MPRSATYLLSLLLACAATCAQAATYYWVNNDANSWHNWNDASSWTDESGNAVTETPTAIDTVASFDATRMMMFADLGGVTNEIAELRVTHGGWWKYDQFGITNGALIVSGTANFESPTPFNIWKDATLCVSNLTFSTKNTGSSGVQYFDNFIVHDGGRLEIHKDFMPRQMNITVESGGYCLYAASAILQNGNFEHLHTVVNSGTMDWPGGLWQHNNAWSVFPCIKQLAGEWILGDKIELPNNLYGRVELTGGTLKATGNVGFRLYGSGASAENAWAKFMPNADITLDVADGKTLDMVRSDSRYVAFAYEPDEDGTNYTKITRTGAGTLLLADVPYSLDLQSGTTTFSANTRTAMGTLKVSAGQSFTIANSNTSLETLEDNAGTITIAHPGLSIGALAAGATLSGAFAFNATAFVEGDTVVTTPDATLRAKIKADAEAAFESAGVAIVESGDTLTIGASTYIFDSTSVTDLNDPAGWQNGLPAAGRDVIVSGAGVNAIVIADLTNVWNSITVQNGAELTVSASDLALPSLVLRGTATLCIEADAMLPDYSSVLDGGDYPTLIIAAGVVLTVPANSKFSNVHLVLCEGSMLREAEDGSLVFGYAAAGETTYFTMVATNATICVTNSLSPHGSPSAYNGLARIDFASPDSGGRVVVPAPIILNGINFKREYSTPDHYIYDGFAFGLNNPEDEAVKIVIDDSFVIFGEHSWVAGGVNLVITNNAVLCRSIFPDAKTKTGSGRNEGDKTENWFNLHVTDLATLTLVDGGELRMGVGYVNGEQYSGLLSLSPSAEGHAGVEVLEGGLGYWYKSNGYQHKTVYNNKWAGHVTHAHRGIVRFAGGCMDIFKDNWYGSGDNRAHILRNMAAVDIVEGTTVTFRGVEDRLSTEKKSLGLVEIESPITGGGNVIVTNTWSGKNLKMIVSCNNNTCTGVVEALDCDGTATAEVYFADGSNWAGTIVANGNVKLIDTVGSDEWSGGGSLEDNPVTVDFGALDLQAEFPIRVWKDGGAIVTNDMINVGAYVNHGGNLVPTVMTDDVDFTIGEMITIGKIAKASPNPAVKTGWCVKRLAIDGDDENEILVMKKGVGFQLIVR